jgi:hypothetical protein
MGLNESGGDHISLGIDLSLAHGQTLALHGYDHPALDPDLSRFPRSIQPRISYNQIHFAHIPFFTIVVPCWLSQVYLNDHF